MIYVNKIDESIIVEGPDDNNPAQIATIRLTPQEARELHWELGRVLYAKPLPPADARTKVP